MIASPEKLRSRIRKLRALGAGEGPEAESARAKADALEAELELGLPRAPGSKAIRAFFGEDLEDLEGEDR